MSAPTPPQCDPERVETVARALWEADNPALAMFSPDELNALWAHNRNDRYRRLAAAAIAADPSPAAPCPTCVREGGPYRCCPHCVDDPDFHKAGGRNHHDLPCTLCLRAALASPAPAPQGEEPTCYCGRLGHRLGGPILHKRTEECPR